MISLSDCFNIYLEKGRVGSVHATLLSPSLYDYYFVHHEEPNQVVVLDCMIGVVWRALPRPGRSLFVLNHGHHHYEVPHRQFSAKSCDGRPIVKQYYHLLAKKSSLWYYI